MSGQKNKIFSLKLSFLIANLLFIFIVILVSLNINEIFRFFQEQYVTDTIDEINEVLNEEDSEVLLGQIVGSRDIELIVTEDEKLVYTSNGIGEMTYADTLYNHGYIYKSIYDREGFLVWVVIYESAVVSSSNLVLFAMFGSVIFYIIVITIILILFFKRVSLPLLQLSNLISKAKTNEIFHNSDELDTIAYELVNVFNEINFSVRSSKKQYSDISKLYDNQKSYIVQQNNHLKTALHDLKNPLSAIRSACYILLQDEALSDRSELMVKNIEKSSDITHEYIAQTLSTVIENISDIYQVEVPINILQVLKDNFEVSSLYVLNKGLKVEIEGDETFVISNSLKFNQVISNIVYNAVKYSKKNTTIHVIVNDESLIISNTIDKEVSSGQGFGLKRVKLICDDLNMDFTTSIDDRVYRAVIKF